MKITTVETFVLGERQVLVRIGTDEGLAGWGDASLEHKPGTVVAAIRELSGHLIGADPLPVTAHWQRLTRGGFYRGGGVLSSAVAGLDMALWDIRGRFFDAPVHVLLGGPCRDRVRLYTHAWGPPEHTGNPQRARDLVEAGYTLVKASVAGPVGFLDSPAMTAKFVDDLTALREAVGPGADFGIDLHGRVSVHHARRLADAVAHTAPAFLEEPLRPEHSRLIGRLTAATSVPIATGERLFSREEFVPVLEGGIAIAQPDPAHAGGITEVFRIATMAESYDVQLAPHCPLGPVALAACVQLDLAVPNFYAQEHIIDLSSAASEDLAILRNPEVLVAVNGHIERPTGPGLGIEIDEDAVRAAHQPDLLMPTGNPQWRYADGGFAEW
ncbi:galactonate dehydratase [Asanoa ferruginea]|uniref:Galactonate dehydratase n=1 Tax=Asanoa ferruginea TaxID=53367 RepID=A0A3D9ZRZ0_9ACTN|nr:galactonate dehydratase [Asanoa ferruginea]REG00147.1 galactonate dehydratase [Asanoa ferruginea]GIF46155.1 galactonate dehydratase [Asanoa ferruginea]